MLSVKITVLSSHGQMLSLIPANCSTECELFVGLVMQYHYVGLSLCHSSVKKNVQHIPNIARENPLNIESNSDSHDSAADEGVLDDATIEKGDEHIRQITCAPQASMMSVENPEAFKYIICVAPAEGQKPLNVMTDPNFEAMSNPDKFPYGKGTFSNERPRKLTYRKYFNQRLLDVDGRFARDLDYLFVAQYILEAKQVLDEGNNFAWRQKPSRQFTASQARDQTVLSQFVRKDKAYSFMKKISGLM